MAQLGNLTCKVDFDGGKALNSLNNMLTKFAILKVSAGQAIDVFKSLGEATIADARGISNLSSVLDLDPERLQKWQLFGEKFGVGAETVNKSISSMRKHIADFNTYGKSETLEKMASFFGVDIGKLTKDPFEALMAVSRQYKSLNETQKNRAFSLFREAGFDPSMYEFLDRLEEADNYEVPIFNKGQLEDLKVAGALWGDIKNTFSQIAKIKIAKMVVEVADSIKELGFNIKDTTDFFIGQLGLLTIAGKAAAAPFIAMKDAITYAVDKVGSFLDKSESEMRKQALQDIINSDTATKEQKKNALALYQKEFPNKGEPKIQEEESLPYGLDEDIKKYGKVESLWHDKRLEEAGINVLKKPITETSDIVGGEYSKPFSGNTITYNFNVDVKSNAEDGVGLGRDISEEVSRVFIRDQESNTYNGKGI